MYHFHFVAKYISIDMGDEIIRVIDFEGSDAGEYRYGMAWRYALEIALHLYPDSANIRLVNIYHEG